MTRLDKIKIYSEIITSIVTVVGAIVAAWWALHEYADKQEQERVQTTLNYRKEFDSEPIISDRRKILDVWLPRENEETDILKSKSIAEFNDFVIKIIESSKLAQPIETVTGFFEVIYICVKRNLCDRETALDLFGSEAEAYYHQHIPYFNMLRERRNDNKIAEGLRQLSILSMKR